MIHICALLMGDIMVRTCTYTLSLRGSRSTKENTYGRDDLLSMLIIIIFQNVQVPGFHDFVT
jgi:hypothetical protein